MIDILEKHLEKHQLQFDSYWGAFLYIDDENRIILEDLINVPIVIDNLEIGKQFITEFFENYKKQLEDYKNHKKKEFSELSNEILLISALNGGDKNWDGDFSDKGRIEDVLLRQELTKRLKEIKFI